MSGIISGLQKFFTKDRIMIFVVFGILVFFLIWYSGNKYNFSDNMESSIPNPLTSYQPSPIPPVRDMDSSHSSNSMNHENSGHGLGDSSLTGGAVQPVAAGGYSNQNVNNPSDLLPVDTNSQWATLNPVNNGNAVIPDLLQAGYHIGIDTIGQTLKNANLQYRSDPYIPKVAVGPWNQSTYEPDLLRVPLEVGCGPQ